MAMIARKSLQTSISAIDLDKWCSSSRELMGIRLQKPDHRHKSLVLINAYIHPNTHGLKESWEFLEEIEDEFGDTIVVCGDLNARSNIWDTQGTNPQGRALEAALQEILLEPLATQTPTHLATRPGDADSTIDLALISPRLITWTRAHTLGPHDSDHLPVVLSLQKPAQSQCTRPQNPFRYNRKGSDIVSRLRARKTRPGSKHNNRTKPPWWNRETEQAWSAKRAAVKAWQTERRKQNPDPNIQARMKELTAEFKMAAKQAKDAKWKDFCDALSADTTLTQFWNFYQQMEGRNNNHTTPDLVDATGTVLKTNSEKGSAFLGRFLEQSDQKNIGERKTLLAGLTRALEMNGHDAEITTEEFSAALGRLKNTAPGPDGVKNTDLQSLSEEEKAELLSIYSDSLDNGMIPEDWTHSFLKPLPKPGKDHRKLNGYRILTMQNTVGKLMECIIARKLARDLEERAVLPPNQGGFRQGKCTWENAAAFAYEVYEGFQRKEQTLAVAIDLEDAYNRVNFKLLIDLLQQYGVSLTITRWIAAAMLERTVVLRLGDWSSASLKLTMGLPQGSPLSPVLYNVYTKGLADLDLRGPARVLTLADDGLIFKTTRDEQQAAEAVQEQLDNAAHWCQETGSSINPSKAQSLWCTLDNKAAGKTKPDVRFNGSVIERTNQLRYLGMYFDRMLTFRQHVEATTLKCRKGLSVLKAMASKGIEQRHLFQLYQSVVLSIMDYGLGLTTISTTNLQKLDRVQNEAMRTILGTTRDTPTEAMRYILDLPPMHSRQKVAQVKAYLSAVENPQNPLHEATKDMKGDRLQRGKSWMGQAEDSIKLVCELAELKQEKEWVELPSQLQHFCQTHISPHLGRQCQEWTAGKTEAEIRTILEQITKDSDILVYTDGSVTEHQSGWGYTVKQAGATIHEDSAAYRHKTASLTMEVEAVSRALHWLATKEASPKTKAVILTDSMSLLQKVKAGMIRSEWLDPLKRIRLKDITWMYCPGHAGVKGNERADRLAGSATIQEGLLLGKSEVLRQLRKALQARDQAHHHSIDRLQERGVHKGSGRWLALRGRDRAIFNQTSIGTISRTTLNKLLKDGAERIWAFPSA